MPDDAEPNPAPTPEPQGELQPESNPEQQAASQTDPTLIDERPGSFYLGRGYDVAAGETSPDPVRYDARDLTTHAVVVGMTGSGKTGLCVSLLEEAALDGVPSIVIDPKGDIGNLLLTFPNLAPEDFEPWVEPAAAERNNLSVPEFAAQQAELWRNGLAKWGQTGERIAALRERADLAIYTPGSTSGRPLAALRSFDAPPEAVRADAEALRERVTGAVSGLCALLGLDADPVRSREHILLSTILADAWGAGRGLELAEIIHRVQDPPFERVGVLGVDAFMKPKERFDLAMGINNLIASPGFAAWMEGDPLDIERLLIAPDGRPRVSVLSIAHLPEAQRMFFVTLLLNEVVSWMRAQSGTSSLRAILYMDEVYGYFPPSKAPPSKRPMLTLMKQARAYGLGVVLATQNPVDLDYKGLSNAGTWFLGRLQTERDKLRVIEGLEGADASGPFDRSEMDRLLAALGKRVFLMHNVHGDGPVVFHTRWALSYLRGPLTRDEIRRLVREGEAAHAITPEPEPQPVIEPITELEPPAEPEPTPEPEPKPEPDPEPTPPPPPPAPAPPTPPPPARASTISATPPPMPAGVPTGYLSCGDIPPGTRIEYRPALVCTGQLHFVRTAAKIDTWEDITLVTPLTDDPPHGHDPWTEADRLPGRVKLRATPPADGVYVAPPSQAESATTRREWEDAFENRLYRHEAKTIYHCKSPATWSKLEEGETSFRERIGKVLTAEADASAKIVRTRYEAKIETQFARVRTAADKVDVEESQARSSGIGAAGSIGAAILGAILGRKKVSATNARRAGTAASRASRAAKEREDIARARDALRIQEEKLDQLKLDRDAEIAEVYAQADPKRLTIEAVTVRPRKGDINPTPLAIAWAPYAVDETRTVRPAWNTDD